MSKTLAELLSSIPLGPEQKEMVQQQLAHLSPAKEAELTKAFAKAAHSTKMALENNTEIERKYLLTGCPHVFLDKNKAATKEGYILQHWLPGDKIQERFREVGPLFVGKRVEGEASWKRTIKMGSGVQRMEFEEDTTQEIHQATREVCAASVSKWRYRVPFGPHLWEIDALHTWRGSPVLWLAEVELPSVATEVQIPVDLAPYIIREVTDSKEYSNRSLAIERGHTHNTQLDIFNLDKKVNLLLPSSVYR